jgi:hypothetical protein
MRTPINTASNIRDLRLFTIVYLSFSFYKYIWSNTSLCCASPRKKLSRPNDLTKALRSYTSQMSVNVFSGSEKARNRDQAHENRNFEHW